MNTFWLSRYYIISIILLFYLIVFLYQGCSKGNEPESHECNFGIFLLQDTTIKIADIQKKGLSNFKLKDVSWISDGEIEYYDYSSHFIYLKIEKSQFFPEYKSFYMDSSWSDRPFVVVANGIACYAGFFLGYKSSRLYDYLPQIDGITILSLPTDVLELGYRTHQIQKDIRDDERVKNALIKANKIKYGLEIELDSIKILNADTTTIEYTITIKNIDKNILYVFDPDKTGSEIFHYYTHGVKLLNIKTNQSYYSKYKKTKHPETLYYYYTKLEINESITRTIILKGFENIPYADYYCQMEYDGPIYGTSKEQRELNDGIIWIGSTLTNILDITFDENNNCRINNRNVIFNK